MGGVAQVWCEPLAHQVDEVVAIKALARTNREPGQAFVKTLDRIAATFDVRVRITS